MVIIWQRVIVEVVMVVSIMAVSLSFVVYFHLTQPLCASIGWKLSEIFEKENDVEKINGFLLFNGLTWKSRDYFRKGWVIQQ